MWRGDHPLRHEAPVGHMRGQRLERLRQREVDKAVALRHVGRRGAILVIVGVFAGHGRVGRRSGKDGVGHIYKVATACVNANCIESTCAFT